jgi:lactoylglutathione lyase
MARIEHIALWSDDIDRLAGFYERYLGATVGTKYANPAKGFESRFLNFEDGARLELMSTQSLQPQRHEPGAQRMGLTHLAFSLGAEAKVDSLTRVLSNAGYVVVEEPRRTGDGYYESVVLDPDGNRVELTAGSVNGLTPAGADREG